MPPALMTLGPPEPRTLGELVDVVVDRQYGGIRTRLAEAMGVSLSYLGKVATHNWPMGAENVLKLAKIAGLSPAYCLRLAGHGELLTLIVDAFGREAKGNGRGGALDEEQRALLIAFAQLTSTQRAGLLAFLQTIRPVN